MPGRGACRCPANRKVPPTKKRSGRRAAWRDGVRSRGMPGQFDSPVRNSAPARPARDGCRPCRSLLRLPSVAWPNPTLRASRSRSAAHRRREPCELLTDGLRFATVATINPDGSPHQAVAWFRFVDDAIVVNSREGRVWPANLRRDPRISLTIEDGYRWISVRGTVRSSTTRRSPRPISPRWPAATTPTSLSGPRRWSTTGSSASSASASGSPWPPARSTTED